MIEIIKETLTYILALIGFVLLIVRVTRRVR